MEEKKNTKKKSTTTKKKTVIKTTTRTGKKSDEKEVKIVKEDDIKYEVGTDEINDEETISLGLLFVCLLLIFVICGTYYYFGRSKNNNATKEETKRNENMLSTTIINNNGGDKSISNLLDPNYRDSAPAFILFDNEHEDGSASIVGTTFKCSNEYSFSQSSMYSLKDAQDCTVNDILNKYILFDLDLNYDFVTTEEDHGRAVGRVISVGNNIYYTDARISTYDVDVNNSSSGLWKTTDYVGDSFYFRGNPNNNLIFGKYCFKIVRINGDNSIRAIYNGVNTDLKCIDTDSTIGKTIYNDSVDSVYNGSNIENFINDWYKNNFINYTDYLSDVGFCNDLSKSDRFDNNNPSLQCDNVLTVKNGKLKYPIGLITNDEVMMAGLGDLSDASGDIINEKNYLYSNLGSSSYLFTMTSQQNSDPYVFKDGHLFTRLDKSNYEAYVRPVFNFKDVEYKLGDGSESNPYIIDSNSRK